MSWIRKIFRGKSDREASATDSVRPTSFSLDDESYHANADVLAGIQFAPPLKLSTPLAALEHFGEVFEGPFSSAPSYCGQDFWVPKVKSEFSLFSDEEHAVASDIGPVKPSTYLPFLIGFRRIVEADLSQTEKKQKIEELRDENENFRAIWDDLNAKSSMFPFGFIESEQPSKRI